MIRLAHSPRLLRGCRQASLSLLLLAPIQLQAQGKSEILSNATIVQMVNGKLSRELIVNKINSATPGFDLSSGGIIYLVTNRVDDRVIKVMLDVADSARHKGNAPASLTGLDEVLNNDAVVKMVGGKVPKQLILQKIRMSPSAYDVSASGLVSLKTNKVPEDVIKVMMSPPAVPAPAVAKEPPPAAAPTAAEKAAAAKPAPADTSKKTKTTTKKPAAPAPAKKKPPTASS